MNSRWSLSSSFLPLNPHTKLGPVYLKNPQACIQLKISYGCVFCCNSRDQKPRFSSESFEKNGNQELIKGKEEPLPVYELDEKKTKKKKKGSVAGAVALIIGTSIGSGILALPQKASPAGLIPSSVCVVVCWGFLLVEALVLIEINLGLQREKKEKAVENDLEVISIRTMAQETLGDWGGTLATVFYVFLSYTSMVAYCSKSGDILFHLINLPPPISAFFFTSFFSLLIFNGGTKTTDQVNQFLTASMIGLLVAIEGLSCVLGEWLGVDYSGDWRKVTDSVPSIIFSLVYHDLIPVLCAYLGNDLKRLRLSVLVGSFVPMLALLVWDAIALGLSFRADQVVDPLELLMRARWSGISYMVEAFSLLAIGTSLIGTLLSFSEFFKEQLTNISFSPSSTMALPKQRKFEGMRKWWRRNNPRLASVLMVVAPSLVISSNIPDSFSVATDIAGGYCMTMLYGVLPPAMAWAMSGEERGGDRESKSLSRSRPVLVGVALFGCGIVVEQLLQHLLPFQT